MNINDQPGRIFAVLVFAPILLYKGFVTYKYDYSLIFLGTILFLWDLFWIVYAHPRTTKT